MKYIRKYILCLKRIKTTIIFVIFSFVNKKLENVLLNFSYVVKYIKITVF